MKSEISFRDYLAGNRVVIPLIQRDYAQGRAGQESLREEFISEIKKALDSNPFEIGSGLKLDFVYGSKEGNDIMPIDGQQRLTTLWLLHWFIAYKAGRLDDETRLLLSNFTYKTRISSTDFCKALCWEILPENNDILRFISSLTFENISCAISSGNSEKQVLERLKRVDNSEEFATEKERILRENFVSPLIIRQTWFYSTWNQDPTIQSMLRMLSGTFSPGKDGYDIIDGFEELFEGTPKEKFNEYFDRLTGEKSPVVFYHLPMEDYGLSDDLYIKMNARGKQLSDFENFKADIVGYLKSYGDEKLLDPVNGLPVKFDTTWTDIFWAINKKFKRTDEVFFAFLNRFFFNYHIEKITDESDPYYEYFTVKGQRQGDTALRYTGLNHYKFRDQEIPQELWTSLSIVLNNLHQSIVVGKIENVDLVHDSKFAFIPHYKEDDMLSFSEIGLVERVIFYSLVRFFERGPVIDEDDKTALRRWTRVVRNIVSVKTDDGKEIIRNIAAMKNAVKIIGLLEPHNVYDSLRSLDLSKAEIAKGFREQLEEERDKAIRILEDNSQTNWEEKIAEAEDYSFFDGAIRFLFHNADNTTDWSDFDDKYSHAKLYFVPDNKIREQCAVNENYSNSTLLRSIMSRFTPQNYWDVLNFYFHSFNNTVASWRYYLLNSNICAPIHNLLKGDTSIVPKSKPEYEADEAEYILYLLSQTDLLDFVITRIPSSWIRYYHNYRAIYPSSDGVFLNAFKRDNFFIEHKDKITVAAEHRTTVPYLFYKSQISFSFKGHNFVWYNNNNSSLKDFIYLMHDEDPWKFTKRDESATTEIGKYYCFDSKELSYCQIFEQMDYLIQETIRSSD